MVVYVMRPDQAQKVKEMAADIGITNVETFTGKRSLMNVLEL